MGTKLAVQLFRIMGLGDTVQIFRPATQEDGPSMWVPARCSKLAVSPGTVRPYGEKGTCATAVRTRRSCLCSLERAG